MKTLKKPSALFCWPFAILPFNNSPFMEVQKTISPNDILG